MILSLKIHDFFLWNIIYKKIYICTVREINQFVWVLVRIFECKCERWGAWECIWVYIRAWECMSACECVWVCVSMSDGVYVWVQSTCECEWMWVWVSEWVSAYKCMWMRVNASEGVRLSACKWVRIWVWLWVRAWVRECEVWVCEWECRVWVYRYVSVSDRVGSACEFMWMRASVH